MCHTRGLPVENENIYNCQIKLNLPGVVLKQSYRSLETQTMKLRVNSLEIPPGAPFSNCKLDREKYAVILKDLIKIQPEGFVMSLSSEWGTGKTTFIRMFEQLLRDDDYKTVYFNAWENDYDRNPLPAILSEFKRISPDKEKSFKKILEKGTVLLKEIGPALIKGLIKKHVVEIDDVTVDVIENTIKASTEILEAEVNEYTKRKESVGTFKEDLSNYIKESCDGKPLIFFVDELDRCRPDYAVEVLEQIKHFYSVPGIVFILSIDKNHLASSVKGFYGSSEIDTSEYLRRFIDWEYNLPKPEIRIFLQYLYNQFELDRFLESTERSRHTPFDSDAKTLLLTAEEIITKSNLTLRQSERQFAVMSVALKGFKANQYILPAALFTLAHLSVMHQKTFSKILNKEYQIDEFAEKIAQLLKYEEGNQSKINSLYVIAVLVRLYGNFMKYPGDLISVTDSYSHVAFTTHWLSDSDKPNFVQCFESIERQYDWNSVSLSYLINRIALLQPLEKTI